MPLYVVLYRALLRALVASIGCGAIGAAVQSEQRVSASSMGAHQPYASLRAPLNFSVRMCPRSMHSGTLQYMKNTASAKAGSCNALAATTFRRRAGDAILQHAAMCVLPRRELAALRDSGT